jgi:hypothetical protein
MPGRGQLLQRWQEAIRPVMTVAREARDARAIPSHHEPITVVLEFVNPQRAGRRSGHLRRQARFDEAGGTPHDHDRIGLWPDSSTARRVHASRRRVRARHPLAQVPRPSLFWTEHGYDVLSAHTRANRPNRPNRHSHKPAEDLLECWRASCLIWHTQTIPLMFLILVDERGSERPQT